MFNNISPVLLRALGVFVVMLVISIVVVSISQVYMDDVYQGQQSARRDMQKWKIKINSSVENNQIIDEFESNFLKEGMPDDQLAVKKQIMDDNLHICSVVRESDGVDLIRARLVWKDR